MAAAARLDRSRRLAPAVSRALVTGLAWAIALAWASRAILALWKLPQVPNLLDSPAPRELPAVQGGGPLLTVIVPARDEAAAVGETLRSLLASEGIALKIVAVNDRSSDRTGEIMHAAAARAPGRLRVIDITELPEGWMGKTHAMALAARDCTTPYILFTDGDIVFAPDALARAMSFVLAEQADHFVLLPTPIVKTAGERMMMGAIQALASWGPRLWRVADPAARDFLGVGAFNLVRTEAYRSVGGFEGLRMEVLEDLRLGFVLKRAGLRCRVAFGRDLVRVHWAPGALGIVRGLTKNAFAVFRFRLWQALPAIAGVLTLSLAPFIGLFGPASMRLACGVSLASLVVLYSKLRQGSQAGPAYVLLFPVAAVLLTYAVARSVVLTLVRGGVVWRGTRYPLRALRQMAGPLR